MLILNWLGIAFLCAAYLAGLRKWIYQGKLIGGLLSILVFFPLLIGLTSKPPADFLRAIPLVGVGMFMHHYGRRLLLQIKLLWFTTLSMLVAQGFTLAYAHGVFGR